jgi:glutamate synthase domain-containing protein 1
MNNEFVSAATNTLKEVAKTMQERGGQYADTWGADGCWHLTKAISEKFLEKTLSNEMCKAIALATFIDQKYSRFAGGYKKDTAVDLVSYVSALADVVDKLEHC